MSEAKEATAKQKMSVSKDVEKMREEAKSTRTTQLKQHKALGAFLNLYLRLPVPLKLVVMFLSLLYSPPMVQNLLNCLRAPTTGRLRVIAGPDYIFFYLAGIWGLMFCWFSMLMGEPTADEPIAGHEILTWLYVALVILTYITVGLDFKGAAWVGVAIILFGMFAVVGWIGSQREIPILEMIWPIFEWFELKVFPRAYVFAISLLSLLVFGIVWIRMNMVNVLKIEGNYVQVWSFAHKSPKDTRASFSIVPDYDDINEALIGFSCRLNLKSKSSRIDSHEFPNMPGGPVVEHIATHLLNAQEVTFAEDDIYQEDDGDGDED